MHKYFVPWKEEQDLLGKITNMNFTNSEGTKFRSRLNKISCVEDLMRNRDFRTIHNSRKHLL